MPENLETENTLGYCFIECDNMQKAEEARKETNGFKFDKSHKLLVNLLEDFDKYMRIHDELAPSEISPYTPGENLQQWLTDEKARDQFVIRVCLITEIFWNDPRLSLPDPVYQRQPGDAKHVTLVSIGGQKIIRGGNVVADGPVGVSRVEKVIRDVNEKGFGNKEQPDAREGGVGVNDGFITEVSHEAYANMYGSTTGDKIRLGDTDLYAEIERDFVVYGDECVFRGGKVIRDGMGQATGYPPCSCLDTVITNAVIIDYTGIYKADIGIKGGNIIAIGKAGNPDVMDGVHTNMIIGVGTEVIAAEGMIVNAGGIDCHVHFICPQLAQEAISSELPYDLEMHEAVGKTPWSILQCGRFSWRYKLGIACCSYMPVIPQCGTQYVGVPFFQGLYSVEVA